MEIGGGRGVLRWIVRCGAVRYCIALYCIVLHCTVLYCAVLVPCVCIIGEGAYNNMRGAVGAVGAGLRVND